MKLQNLSLKINRKLILAQSDWTEPSARPTNYSSKSLRIKAEIISNRIIQWFPSRTSPY